MRCGKCGYISFDSQEKCGRCGRDLGEMAGQLGGTATSLEAPQWLAGGLAAEQALAGADEPEADPVETLVLDPNHDVPVDEAAELAFVLEDVTAPALADVDFGEEISLRDEASLHSAGPESVDPAETERAGAAVAAAAFSPAAEPGQGEAIPEVEGYGSFDLLDLEDIEESAAGAGPDPSGEKTAPAAPAAGYRKMEDVSDLLEDHGPEAADDQAGPDELVLSLDDDQALLGAEAKAAELPDIPDLGLSLESAEEADEEKDK
ncbi:hypothetical protein [Desulfurivibrio sp. C05AmB]|jgi:hypothetical protein|uniref:hypothetical protein n=1 Tax=Desulfurivibrio sp. C05AmB TaxID=3374371 RepID=UPI00376EBF06